jgi:putative addiction module component (TIGR02574 family)
MPTLDYSHLSARERLDLIGEIWDSIDAEAVTLTSAQEAELDRRRATLDEDIEQGRDAAEALADLRRRYR